MTDFRPKLFKTFIIPLFTFLICLSGSIGFFYEVFTGPPFDWDGLVILGMAAIGFLGIGSFIGLLSRSVFQISKASIKRSYFFGLRQEEYVFQDIEKASLTGFSDSGKGATLPIFAAKFYNGQKLAISLKNYKEGQLMGELLKQYLGDKLITIDQGNLDQSLDKLKQN